MEGQNNQLVVFTMKVKMYPNEYSEKFKSGMFRECIKIDPLTCVYRHWDTTRYSLESMPTAHVIE